MKRWNGWGDEAVDFPLPDPALRHLSTIIGEGNPVSDASFEEALGLLPAPRIAVHPLVSTDLVDRLRHARGQSLPDWIALRSGRLGTYPDGIAYPASDEEVHALLDFARHTGTRVIPYGGGTSVVGHVNPLPDESPVLTLDLSCLNRLLSLDETSRLATFEAGAHGPEIEAQLRARGYTLGHYPQSFEFSTLGGWIATRSSGQQSYYYGRIEQLFAGGHVETPVGPLELPSYPASAAGPDVRQMILGSEGRLGVITRAVVRVRRWPESESFHAVFFRDWDSGIEAARAAAQSGIAVSMIRLSDAEETVTTLMLAGHERLLYWADRMLVLVGYCAGRCLLLFGVTGDRVVTDRVLHQMIEVVRAHGGLLVGEVIGRRWQKSRFLAPYLRNVLWERGYALDTLETAVSWSAVFSIAYAIKAALRDELTESGERVHAFAHLSHVYADGASVYATYLFRRAADPEETLRRWQRLKGAACRAVVKHGGTISHQHGVGLDHASYLAVEKGEVGMKLIEAARRALDPDGLLNPGKLIAE